MRRSRPSWPIRGNVKSGRWPASADGLRTYPSTSATFARSRRAVTARTPLITPGRGMTSGVNEQGFDARRRGVRLRVEAELDQNRLSVVRMSSGTGSRRPGTGAQTSFRADVSGPAQSALMDRSSTASTLRVDA